MTSITPIFSASGDARVFAGAPLAVHLRMLSGGAPISTVGHTFRMSVFRSRTREELKAVEVAGSAGDILLAMSGGDTADLYGKEPLRIEIVEQLADGVQPYLNGSLTILPRPTDDPLPATSSGTAAAYTPIEVTVGGDVVILSPTGVKGDTGDATAFGVVSDNVAYVPRQISFGDTPDNVRYEMNSGGQPAFEAATVQIADLHGLSAIKEYYRFWDDPKPIVIQFGKNRGDGTPGSATFGRKTLAGDRLFMLAVYGGKDSNGTNSAFAHAGYLTWAAEADNNGGNEQDATFHLRPGSTSGAAGAGNGIQGNSRMQVAVPGPNQGQFNPGDDYGAILRLGAGGVGMTPLRLTPGTLKAVPVEASVEYDPAGVFWITQGLTGGTLARRAVVTNIPGQVSSVMSAAGSVTFTSGMGWAKIVLMIGPSDYSVLGIFATITFAAGFAAVPVVVGSRDGQGGTSFDGGHEFLFGGKATNKITLSMYSGTLLAGQTYAFNLLWIVP